MLKLSTFILLDLNMTIKQVLRSFLFVVTLFIPFYWIKSLSSKPEQLNTNNEEDLENRKLDDYKRSDVDNEIRGIVRGLSLVAGITFGTLGVAALTIPVVGWGFGFALAVVVGMGIIPTILEMLAKQSIRGISWLQHKDDPEIINPTYPAKYKAYTWSTSSFEDKVIEKLREEDNSSTEAIMRKLYLKKQEIKNNPEGWFGLSDEQQEHCTAINLAVKFFRNNSCYHSWSYLTYPDPDHNPTKCERVYKRTLFAYDENDGLTSEMKEYLDEVIDIPNKKQIMESGGDLTVAL